MSTSDKPKISAKESAALVKLFEAWRELKLLGWNEPMYFRFPKAFKEFEVIELGSTGIHRAVHHGEPEKVCWVDYEWPSHPFLVRNKVGDAGVENGGKA